MRKPPASGQRGSPLRAVLTGNVLALGTVSLLTDISTEMVGGIIGAYLVFGLGLTTVGVGAVDGFYQGATAVTRLAGGYVADRFGARKVVAGVGYGLGAVAKLGLILLPSAGGVTGSLGVDRIGKGIRTSPRDALISEAVPEERLARAFGVHRAMDACGAFLGPLVAMAVLAAVASSTEYRSVFVVSAGFAILGFAVLVLFVRERPAAAGDSSAVSPGDPREPAERPALRELLGLYVDRMFLRLQLAAILLGIVTIGDTFVWLRLLLRDELSSTYFPLLAVLTNLSFLLQAVPMGALADRIGRWRVLIGGHVALGVVYLLLSGSAGGWVAIVAVFVLYGAFYAATEGVIVAAVSPTVPARLRTSGIALVQTGQALAYLMSSVGFGLAWHVFGPEASWRVAGIGVLVLVVPVALLLRPDSRRAKDLR